MQQFGNKYSDAKLSQMKMWMQDMIDKETPKYYEVYVDDTLVVAKTQNLDDFDDHKAYMDQDTQFIKIFIYNTPNTHRYKQYVYEVKPAASKSNLRDEKSLSGIEVDEKIAIAKERWESDRIKEKLFQKEKELAEAEQYIEKLTALNEKLKEENDQSKSKGWLGIAEKLFTHPRVIDRVGEFAGLFPPKSNDALGQLETQQSAEGEEEETDKDDTDVIDLRTKVEKEEEQVETDDDTETAAEEEPEEQLTVTPGQQKVLLALQKIGEKLPEKELDKLGTLMDRLADDPALIGSVTDLI